MKQFLFILFLICSLSILIGQEKNEDAEMQKKLKEEEKAKIKKEMKENREVKIIKEPQRKYEGRYYISTKPKYGQKGVATYSKNGLNEEFEFEETSDGPTSEDSRKEIHVHCPLYDAKLGYSSLYLLKSKKLEDNIEIQIDMMFILTLGIRATIDSDNNNFPSFTFFSGVNFDIFQLEYGYSEEDFHVIRCRRSINFYLAQKTDKNNTHSRGDGEYFRNFNHSRPSYHYNAFISSIYIEPIIEYRFGIDGQKPELVVGLSFGVSF